MKKKIFLTLILALVVALPVFAALAEQNKTVDNQHDHMMKEGQTGDCCMNQNSSN